MLAIDCARPPGVCPNESRMPQPQQPSARALTAFEPPKRIDPGAPLRFIGPAAPSISIERLEPTAASKHTPRRLHLSLNDASTIMLAFLGLDSFDINKLRPHLKMAVQRIGIATNKKTQAIK